MNALPSITELSQASPEIISASQPAHFSAAFWERFGKSRILNADGTPKLVYHGTTKTFDQFKRRRSDIGIHFGTLGQALDRINYLQRTSKTHLHAQNIRPCYLRIENPLRMVDTMSWGFDRVWPVLVELFPPSCGHKLGPLRTLGDIRRFLLAEGFDGIVYRNMAEVTGQDQLVMEAEAYRMKVFGKKRAFTTAMRRTPEYKVYRSLRERIYAHAKEFGEDSWIVFSPDQVISAFEAR